MNYWTGGRLVVPRAGSAIDTDGNLADAAIREQLQKYLSGFAAFVAAGGRQT